MNLTLVFHTIKYLKFTQIYHQIKNRIYKPRYKHYELNIPLDSCHYTQFISKTESLLNNQNFIFLNLQSQFNSWNDTRNGMLWAYNLNYMDWLNQKNISFEEGNYWIEKFITELPDNKIGLDPYPIALRGINWIKFITIHKHKISQSQINRWNSSLFSQYKLLINKLEYHLLGNHLLEDAYSLFIASLYFSENTFFNLSSKLILNELKEQLLPDGAHYEQSPMYHSILLERLLDCYNLSINNIKFKTQKNFNEKIQCFISQMLGHLESICYSDKSYPLFNDSALNISSSPHDLFDYAKRLNISWDKIELKTCGYRKFQNDKIESFIDIGYITASYQPGHSHSDTFSYEMRINNQPFIIDTGISTYNKNIRRQYERATVAHNTVSIDNQNSNEVWGGFRVGKRAKVKIIEERKNYALAEHYGFGKQKTHQRCFDLQNQKFDIIDKIQSNTEAISYIHLAPNIDILEYNNKYIKTTLATINIEGALKVIVETNQIAQEYNTLKTIKVIQIKFKQHLKYSIEI